MIINSECRGCTYRYAGCHGKCEKYQEYKEKKREEEIKIFKARMVEARFVSHAKNTAEAIRKGTGKSRRDGRF